MTTRQPYLSMGLQLFLMSNLSNVTANDTGLYSRTVVVHLSQDCKAQHIRLDKEDNVEFRSNEWSDTEAPVEAGVSCKAHFMTGSDERGICIRNNDLYFKRPGISIEFSTTQLGSEKVLRRDYHQFRQWCTSQSILTITVTSHISVRDQNDEYRFSFRVYNVSKSEIQRQYTMDSFKYCDRSYNLESGEEIMIMSQRSPPTGTLPLSCFLSLTTTSGDEYEELCVTVESYKKPHDCRSSLEVTGFMARFWPEKSQLGCNDTNSKMTSEEMCSSGKALTFNLTRTNDSDTGFAMRALVTSKRHPHWELLSQEESELRGLGFMRGLTYFIATVDCLAGLLAVVLASMFRHPRWFWKDWATSARKGSLTCGEAVHYEAASYPEPPNQEIEKMPEASAY